MGTLRPPAALSTFCTSTSATESADPTRGFGVASFEQQGDPGTPHPRRARQAEAWPRKDTGQMYVLRRTVASFCGATKPLTDPSVVEQTLVRARRAPSTAATRARAIAAATGAEIATGAAAAAAAETAEGTRAGRMTTTVTATSVADTTIEATAAATGMTTAEGRVARSSPSRRPHLTWVGGLRCGSKTCGRWSLDRKAQSTISTAGLVSTCLQLLCLMAQPI